MDSMNKKINFLGIFLIAFFSYGCASLKITPRVQTETVSYYKRGYLPTGSISVVPIDTKQINSLEYNHYKEKIEEKLQSIGYTIEESPSLADHIASFNYSIDNGITVTGSSNALESQYDATSPSYFRLVNVERAYSSTTYTRVLNLVIFDPTKSSDKESASLYQATTTSVGTCNIFSEVFDEILTGLFSNFLRKNGENDSLAVPGEVNC